MGMPNRLIDFNRRYYNPAVRWLAAWLPTMGVLYHTGRKSGKEYRTVLNVFRCPQGYACAIAYGRESDWVQNVLHAGSCDVVTMGRRVRMIRPRIVVDETRRLLPALWRPMLRWLKITDFMVLEPETSSQAP